MYIYICIYIYTHRPPANGGLLPVARDALLSDASAAVSNIVGGAEVSSTLHPQPSTLNPEPWTLNPEP